MKRLAIFLLFATSAFAQTPLGGYVSPSSGGGGATQVTSLPATCTAGTQYQLASGQVYVCGPSNTFIPLGSAPNSPLSAINSGPGPVFNVRNYGALGDWQSSGNCTVNNTTTVVCTDAAFVNASTPAGDAGKKIGCGYGVSNNYQTALVESVINTVSSGTTVVVSNAAALNQAGVVCAWGTEDEAAIQSALTGAIAAAKTSGAGNGTIEQGILAGAPWLYFPAGGYALCTTSISIVPGSVKAGFVLSGDGWNATRIYALPGCNFGGANGIIFPSGNISYFYGRDFTLAGLGGAYTTGFNAAIYDTGAAHRWQNVYLTQLYFTAFYAQGQDLKVDMMYVIGNQSGGGSGAIVCASCQGEFHDTVTSNNSPRNLYIQNTVGISGGIGLRWWGGLVDEDGQSNSVTSVVNSSDISFIGASLFSTSSGNCLEVDPTSFVHMSGGVCAVFAQDTNAGALKIDAGGQFQASDVRFSSTGTGKCIANSGSFYNNGGNSCESQFPVASGTSTTTTAVLTVTPGGANANTNCTIGDSLMVQGVSPGGYNGYYPFGITGVTATTITYTTIGSGIGAAGAGGTASCRNMQTYSGTLPHTLLSPNVLNFQEGAVNLTASTIGTWTPDRGTIINRIQATNTAGNVTCATPLVIQVSNGTSTQSLTLTSGASTWDSGTGTSLYYKPNTAITVTQTATAACAVPPVNLNITVNTLGGMDN